MSPLLIVTFLLAAPALAHHSDCTWDVGDLSVQNHEWALWCRAYPDNLHRYKCIGVDYMSDRQVADWGVLQPKVLELGECVWLATVKFQRTQKLNSAAAPCPGTACGKGGYGYDPVGNCWANFWAACPDGLHKCYGFWRKDDCEVFLVFWKAFNSMLTPAFCVFSSRCMAHHFG